ncbi:MAG: glycosyltransferase, partial [Leptothrix sp. (in: b-proteobacteria)]
GGSFVLPYVHGLVRALQARGHEVTLYASLTRYNIEFLADLQEAAPRNVGIHVVAAPVSGSVAPRWRGVPAYLGLLLHLWWHRRNYDSINLQFSALWPAELPLWWLLGRQLVYTVHNAVPHGFKGLRHRPTAWIAACARALVFASRHSQGEFMRRYGDHWSVKSTVVPHGLLPLAPGDSVTPYRLLAAPSALVYWSTVKPYKGVELFAELGRSPEIRQRGLELEVHGAWSSALADLKRELLGLGVRVDDSYLSSAELRTLFGRDVVFILPYLDASQSGALFALLNHGCVVICADVGDLGDFMRRHGLQGLLLRERSSAAVIECLDYLRSHAVEVQQRLSRAQAASAWGHTLADAWPVFEGGV